jgi:hypothetical protein
MLRSIYDEKRFSENGFILVCSGSMVGLEKQTINGYNKLTDKQKLPSKNQ